MMPHDDPRDWQTDLRRASAAHRAVRSAWDDSDAGVRGQRIANCLFSAGLDVHFALMVAGDGPAASQLRHAVDQIDDAIRELRFMMLAIPEQGVPPSVDGDGSSAEP
jgi:hypothetical protein